LDLEASGSFAGFVVEERVVLVDLVAWELVLR
jgi:hypothetical protein